MARPVPSCAVAPARRAAACALPESARARICALLRALRTGLRALCLLALGVLGAGAAASAQDELGRGPDPYTKGEPEALADAGYVGLELRAWAGDHGTRDVQEVLGAIPLVWIETEHFRLGSSLPEIAVEKHEKDRVRAELKRLKRRLPRVKDRAKTLDPWLRAHLYAQRLEELYARFQELAGVTDADFAAPAAGSAERPVSGEPQAEPVVPAQGSGPYLGMQGKFCVLLLERSSSVGRYAARWGHGGEPAPQVLNFSAEGSLALVTCEEWFTGDWDHDTALFCHVTWFVSQNLLRGYRGYQFDNSLWLRQGLGHCLSRAVDERFNTLPRARETLAETFERSDWAPSVRARVGHELYPSLAEMSLWKPTDERSFADHRMVWSRADWLLAQEPEALARFLREAKAPIDAPGRVPAIEEIAAQEAAALQAAFGLSSEQADEAWVAWVERRYPRK